MKPVLVISFVLRRILQILTFTLLLAYGLPSYAQEDKLDHYSDIIQLSGIVVSGDSAYGVPGVFLYLPKTGQGTMSNHVGYFSIAVKKSDTLEIRALGYKRKIFMIPEEPEEKLSVIIELVQDTITYPAITITAFPSEREFKQAFLAQDIPEEELDNMYKNLNDQIMSRLLVDLELDGSETSAYYMQQQVNQLENRNMAPVITLADPFAWSRFIKDLKEHKRKKEEEKSQNRKY